MLKCILRIVCFLVAFVILQTNSFIISAENAATNDAIKTPVTDSDDFDYSDYLSKHTSTISAKENITLTGDSAILSEAVLKQEFEGFKKVVEFATKKGSASFKVTVDETAFYSFIIRYYPIVDKGTEISLGIKVNGEFPYSELSILELPICWKDDLSENGEFKADYLGNDIIPNQKQIAKWLETEIKDNQGYYEKPLQVVLNKGTNIITFESNGVPFAIESVTLTSPEINTLPSYEEYYNANSKKANNTPDSFEYTIQAEKPTVKSAPVLYPVYERSDPEIQPSSAKSIKRNIIGSGWNEYGQFLEWDIEVPEDGFYRIAFKYRQNEIQEAASLRKLYIDNKIPFKEAEKIGFEYSRNFSVYVPEKEGMEYSYYLTKGKHTLKLEVTLGAFSEIVRNLSDIQARYSDLYRRIIMVTSTAPDIYRDYDIEAEIPTLVTEINSLVDELTSIKKLLDSEGEVSADTATLDEIIEQLKSFLKKPYTIPERLNRFSSNNTTLATYINDLKSQPLVLDYIIVSSDKVELPKANAGFFERLLHDLKSFIYTFSEDYRNDISAEDDEKTIEVWLNSGREQLNVLSGLISESFTEKFGINVNLKLVHCTLVQSVLADMEPDVMVTVSRNDPVDLALRGAIEPLDGYDGFDELKKEYFSEAFVPYMLENKTYAIPETQAFNMMFYRTDIFKKLGLSVPQTWDEFYNISKKIVHKNMEVGIPYSADFTCLYPTLLYQKGGEYFNKEQTAMALNTPEAISSFKTWTDFYTQLSFSLFKDDYNRFRTGEMPLAILGYTFYNTLMTAAPEIKGKWEMVPIPGTLRDDGTIDRTTTATGSAAIILSASDNKEASWEFLKWWTSADIQARYGNQLEYILGPAVRATPANINAFKQIPWTTAEANVILQQWESVREIPNVPGGYYVTRNIDNAFRAVTTRNQNYRETLNYWTNETNREIVRKRKQYGLE